ncbi:MAG: hypothetical protein M1825_003828 [Sarcosagium campestre]|nr:MAG: hypothetical protein M1825_003828 [Sarcosagium campestre]
MIPAVGSIQAYLRGSNIFSACSSKETKVASFVRPSRPAEPPLGFLDALRRKYVSGEESSTLQRQGKERPVEWGGKVVEEVGFEKIRQQMANLSDLHIVLLDNTSLAGVTSTPVSRDGRDRGPFLEQIHRTCAKIHHLDLSRNLLECWQDVLHICGALRELKILRVRFAGLNIEQSSSSLYPAVEELDLDRTLLTWEEITRLTSNFPSLQKLSASSNHLTTLSDHLAVETLTKVVLEGNGFKSLSDVSSLSHLPCLETLHVGFNEVRHIRDPGSAAIGAAECCFKATLKTVDLSNNAIDSWDFINGLAAVFPGLTNLRVSRNPLYTESNPDEMNQVEAGFMATVARLEGLQVLNFSNITDAERSNAELYYLSRIAKMLASTPLEDEQKVLAQHRRYGDLCKLYGAPSIMRTTGGIDPQSLEARLIHFTFRLGPSGVGSGSKQEETTRTRDIPRNFDIYRLKGIVGRMFGMWPLSIRLTWESEEWDPVAGHAAGVINQQSTSEIRTPKDPMDETQEWHRRDVELEDGTRNVGFWVEGREAIVRVETREP